MTGTLEVSERSQYFNLHFSLRSEADSEHSALSRHLHGEERVFTTPVKHPKHSNFCQVIVCCILYVSDKSKQANFKIVSPGKDKDTRSIGYKEILQLLELLEETESNCKTKPLSGARVQLFS